MLENPFVPDEIKAGLYAKQAEFLAYEGREALYGGAAGGGKSVCLLLAALQYVTEPGYAALILRRTYKQLAKADSILAKAKEWLLGKVRYNGDEHKFTFPSGATLEFGHMDHEDSKHDYQGGSWAFVGADEATQFTGPMLAYPRTRQRRPVTSRIPIRWRGASNPGGVGHEYVKARYVKDKQGQSPCTPDRQFFPATIEDNPHIDRDDYVKQLVESGVDGLLLAQLLKGDWDAVAGGRFRREWFPRYYQRGDYITLRRPGEPAPGRSYRVWELHRFGTCDPAASAKNTSDWTVMGVWAVTPLNELVLLDADRFQLGIPDITPRLESLYQKWRLSSLGIEGVAANDGVYQLAERSTMAVTRLLPLGQDKLVRSAMATNLAQAGRIWLPEPGLRPGMPLDEIEGELYRYTGDEKQDAHDDVVDVVSYAARALGDGMTGAGGAETVPHILGGR